MYCVLHISNRLVLPLCTKCVVIFWNDKLLSLFFGLWQVVSEVIFPSVDSSTPVHRAPVSNGSPVLPSSAAPPPSDPPGDTHNSMEVIAQLLQEAEGELCAPLQRKQLPPVMRNVCFLAFSDSDEKEFEDDPLLQVLRKQRMWIREQIR